MIRTMAITAALAAASVAAVPASARTYGGITLSFGTSDYGSYGYSPYDQGYYGYYADPWGVSPDYYAAPRSYSFYYGNDPAYGWRAYHIREQIERWRRDQERRRYWEWRNRERHHWYHDDHDGD
jgi:hypothetical protein